MRYVVVGAGAIGGTLGALLAEGGRDVLLVARGEHAEVMRRDGLRLTRPDRSLVVHPPVTSAEDLQLQPGDVLVLALKSQGTAGLLEQIASLPVGDTTAGEVLPVFCAQNGLDNERQALRRFASVHGICLMLPATHLDPGQVINNGAPLAGVLELGCYPKGSDEVDAAVAEDLNACGFSATVREDVMVWKRAKLLRNVGNAVEALGGHDAPEDAVQELTRRARDEAEACFTAAGLAWTPDDEWDAHRGTRCEVVPVDGQERSGGSTWQSVRRGAGNVEADYLNGEICLLGRLHDVRTPVNALLLREVNVLARRGSEAGSVDLTDLLSR